MVFDCSEVVSFDVSAGVLGIFGSTDAKSLTGIDISRISCGGPTAAAVGSTEASSSGSSVDATSSGCCVMMTSD